MVQRNAGARRTLLEVEQARAVALTRGLTTASF